MTQGMQTLEGWYTLHDFRTVDWHKWNSLSDQERESAKEEIFTLLGQWQKIDEDENGSFAVYEIAGHKADAMFMNLRPTLGELIELERQLNKTKFASITTPVYSFVSMAELSNYVVANRDEDPMNDPMVKARLFPKIPNTQSICFYPMNKKREGQDNWYSLPFNQRRDLMRSHGLTGRKYAGRISQMIGGSIGLDDWEWCVSLFSDDPVNFKKVVTEMRFDEVSARFAEFGPFYVGNKMSREQLIEML